MGATWVRVSPENGRRQPYANSHYARVGKRPTLCYIHAVKPRDIATLVLIASLWGASYIFIRIIVPAIGPWGMVGGRMLLSALALYVVMRMSSVSWGAWRLVPHYVLIAFFSSFLAQYFIASAALTLNAGTLAILNSTAAMFAAVLSVMFLGESLTVRRAMGLVIGVIGVATVVGFTPLPFTREVVLAFVGSLAAAAFYAGSNVYITRHMAKRPALELAMNQCLFAGLLALPFAVPSMTSGAWTVKVVIALAALSVACTMLANGLFYGLMKRTSPTISLSVTYLIPCFSLVWGWLFLEESITWSQVAGFGVIVLALTLVTARRQSA